MNTIPKQYLMIGGAVIAVIVIIVGVLAMTKGNTKPAVSQTPTAEEEEPAAVPTVDASVQVSAKPTSTKKELMLTIDGIPEGTEAIEYLISYETKGQGTQGLNSILELEEGDDSIERKMTLGTCSGPACVYHEVVGDEIKVELKFSGSYGEKVFQKDFPW